METICKKCGKPLRDPTSIARGVGPKCAGIAGAGKIFHSSRSLGSGAANPEIGKSQLTMNLFYFGEDLSDRIPPKLYGFPLDLVDLVLSAPPAGSIAARVKSYARRNKEEGKIHPITLLKQIRYLCIESRLLFWPGLSQNLEPIPCIPHGESDWKLGENGRIMSKDELVAYLSRYGIIGREQMLTSMEITAPK